jgi:crotonobetainyl-CoA:carnitine CoA-transferase CaiB-like acyl-CoA transferase
MPLAGRRFVVAGGGAVADEAAAILAALGADLVRADRVTTGLDVADVAGAVVAVDGTGTLARSAPALPVVGVPVALDARRAWARSGAMALTGEPGGPPRSCPSAGLPVRLTAAGAVVQLLADTTFGAALELDAMALLGERAALTGHARGGSVSVGGACEMVRTADGWIALNLPRADDVALLPAWLDGAIDDAADAIGMARAVARRRSTELVARGAELGLALASWPASAPAVDGPFRIGEPHGRRRRARTAPVVVDLSSLWAGPMAGGLLAQAGACVIKVEGARRPDGARRGNAAFFDLLNAGKRCITVDFEDAEDGRVLAALIARADLVIEGSRPRVMERLGIDVDRVVSDGTSWLSITAYGRDGVDANRVGFGDDVAVGAGLAIDGDPPLFVGDAIADPITGLYAAIAGLACLGAPTAHFVDAPLARATRYAAGVVEHDVDDRADDEPIAAPRSRPGRGAAEAYGAGTADVLAELVPDAAKAQRAKMPSPRSFEGDL